MTKLLTPRNETELMMLRSVLDAEGISYRVHNEHFGGLYPGLNIFALNERVIFVDDDDYERARLVVHDFLEVMHRTSAKGQLSTIPRPGCSPQSTDSGA